MEEKGSKANGNDYIVFYLFEQENCLMEKMMGEMIYQSFFFK